MELLLHGNPWVNDTRYNKPEEMPCSVGFYEKTVGVCTLCPRVDASILATTAGALLAGLLVAFWAVWILADAHWQPESNAGIHAVVYYGRQDTAHEVALTWREMIVNRLQCPPGGVQLDHAEKLWEPGDRVLVSGLWTEGKKGKPNLSADKTISVRDAHKLEGQMATVIDWDDGLWITLFSVLCYALVSTGMLGAFFVDALGWIFAASLLVFGGFGVMHVMRNRKRLQDRAVVVFDGHGRRWAIDTKYLHLQPMDSQRADEVPA